MTKRIAVHIQGGGVRRIAALFGHSDNAGDAQRDRVSLAGLSLTGSWVASPPPGPLRGRMRDRGYFERKPPGLCRVVFFVGCRSEWANGSQKWITFDLQHFKG